MAPPTDRRTPPTCEIRDWTVFGPGYWRGSLYSPEDCARVPENFKRVRGFIDPVVKLGHDKKQSLIERLKKSLGFLSLGDVGRMSLKPGSRFAVTLVNVPTILGGLVNANRIKSGSVELIPFALDPKDQSKKIEGPIFTGISFLGEEHPAVKGLPPPRAVFADGTPVPPNHDLTPWFEAMAEIATEMSADPDAFSEDVEGSRVFRDRFGNEYPLATICFAEVIPVLDDAFLSSIGCTPDQISQIMQQQGGGAPGGDMPPPGGGAPPPGGGGGMPGGDLPAVDAIPPVGGGAPGGGPPPGAAPPPGLGDDKDKDKMSQDDQTMMSDAPPWAKKIYADVTNLKQQTGSISAKMSDATKREEMACAQAYADRVDLVLNANPKRIPPNMKSVYRKMGYDALVTKSFGDAVKNNQERAFQLWKAFIESLPEASVFAEVVGDSAPEGGAHASPLLRKMARPGGFLDRHGSAARVRNRLNGSPNQNPPARK